MKDLGLAKKILGVKVNKNRIKGLIFMTQRKYLTKVLETYKILDSKPVQIPFVALFKPSNSQLLKTDKEKLDMKNMSYTNIVGRLMYAMV